MKYLLFVVAVLSAFCVQAKEKVLIIEAAQVDVARAIVQGVNDGALASHGLIIRDIINRSKGLEGLIVEGDVDKPEFWAAVEKVAADNKIRFANMSFDFLIDPLNAPPPYAILPPGVENPIDLAHRETKLVKTFILGHPEILFMVASGNGMPDWGNDSVTLDGGGLQLMPVVTKADNIVAVGAIDANDIDQNKFPVYKMTAFSNFGIINADLLAPGVDFVDVYDKDASGQPTLASGTSFAAPYVFLAVDGVLGQLPAAGPLQIKEILLKSVYIGDIQDTLSVSDAEFLKLENGYKDQFVEFLGEHPQLFPVKSGGIVFPDRAELVAALLKAQPQLSVEEAAYDIVKGSGLDADSYKTLWKNRGL